MDTKHTCGSYESFGRLDHGPDMCSWLAERATYELSAQTCGIPSTSSLPSEEPGKDLMQSGSPKPIKVMIFEASEMGCQLLAHELEHSSYGIKVIGYSTSALDVNADLARTADVALISSSLQDGPTAGFKVLRCLQPDENAVRCVMLLDHDDPDLALEAFRSGASGICERNNSCQTLCKCIHRVHHGQIWATNQQVRHLLEALAGEGPRTRTCGPRCRSLRRRKKFSR